MLCGMISRVTKFLSTPSARRATLPLAFRPASGRISIHALREEGDTRSWRATRPPKSFLSTPSARRATLSPAASAPAMSYFYPRPPRGGRPPCWPAGSQSRHISIHALLAEGDPTTSYMFSCLQVISIHALREEGDRPGIRERQKLWDFYPRPPRGGRPMAAVAATSPTGFLSTPSARRATACALHRLRRPDISIHALREEGDRTRRGSPACRQISIHALREEGDILYPRTFLAA